MLEPMHEPMAQILPRGMRKWRSMFNFQVGTSKQGQCRPFSQGRLNTLAGRISHRDTRNQPKGPQNALARFAELGSPPGGCLADSSDEFGSLGGEM